VSPRWGRRSSAPGSCRSCEGPKREMRRGREHWQGARGGQRKGGWQLQKRRRLAKIRLIVVRPRDVCGASGRLSAGRRLVEARTRDSLREAPKSEPLCLRILHSNDCSPCGTPTQRAGGAQSQRTCFLQASSGTKANHGTASPRAESGPARCGGWLDMP
jgi:hypothetical protein